MTVQVGEPPEGPDRKGGGTNEEADAPDSGAADGPASGGAPAGTPTARPREPRPSRRDRRRPPRPAERAAGRVAGIELASLSGLSTDAGRDAVQAAARRGRQRDERPDHPVHGGPRRSPPGLLAAGGWREARPGS